MNEQEEIRKGLHAALQGNKPTPVGEPCIFCEITLTALKYLHSKRCRIEVDKELPKLPVSIYGNYSPEEIIEKCRITQRMMLASGYVATEPLVEE